MMVVLEVIIGVALVMGMARDGLAMHLHRSWNEKDWCENVVNARWPFAYESDGSGLIYEPKGRVKSNIKNFAHVCNTRGVQSKCHRCEDIACGAGLSQTCHFQVQGIDWNALNKNFMTSSDTPWAVGGAHRTDYAGAGTSRVCVMTSSGNCVASNDMSFDFRDCEVRCWGSDYKPEPKAFPDQQPDPMLNRNETVGWEWDETLLAGRPQGMVTVLAGSKNAVMGYQDGPADQALFNHPTSVAIDKDRNVYIADSGNHCIRLYNATTQTVSTLAGNPTVSGFKDGLAIGEALFDTPRAITLYYDWGVKYDSRTNTPISNGIGELVLVISDSNNHRLRKIVLPLDDSQPLIVETLAGRKGENPSAGYADGDAKEAQFNIPAGIIADDDGVVFVADSHNHLIRRVRPDGDTFTLAGTVESIVESEREEASCRHPCLRGVPGQDDGTLSTAKFFFPSDVSIGREHTILVIDGNRLRQVTRNGTTSVIQGITYTDSVTTIAGQMASETFGKVDGEGAEASFNAPASVTMDTTTNRIFIADTGSCRIRRVTPADQVAELITCDATLSSVVLPSGCSSYDPPLDGLLLKTTDIAHNVHYNYETRKERRLIDGWFQAEHAYQGRKIYRCQGSPPPINGLTSTGTTLGPRLDTDVDPFTVDEDTDQGTAIYVKCPSGCVGSSPSASVYGFQNYTDDSSICLAAIQAGIITDTQGGLVRIVVLPGQDGFIGQTANGVTSLARGTWWNRGFKVETYPIADVQVSTIAGIPAAPLEDPCGTPNDVGDYSLPLRARFNMPQGIAIAKNVTVNGNLDFLYIADTNNHAIRALTASCSKVCENGGVCVGDELCQCQSGWGGDDCSKPVCATPCSGPRQVCVGPDECACVPGYSNMPACDQALCIQTCENGGTCGAPDTCDCAPGWMDSNCTTPVCSQTCGNGGNCTAPDTCTCPSDWTGPDCRTPVCRQTCANGGSCVAPDTCYCPPEWSGHDCSMPVCTQGFLVKDPSNYFQSQSGRVQRIQDHSIKPFASMFSGAFSLSEEDEGYVWRQYVPCDDSHPSNLTWCDATNGFDCAQLDRFGTVSSVLRGPSWRAITGFGVDDGSIVNNSSKCVRLELTIGSRTPFPYEMEDFDQHLTDLWRYPPSTPYGWNASYAQGPDTIQDWFNGKRGWQASHAASADRMIAHVRWDVLNQGVYVCANGGNCTAPDTCMCAPGWTGFDCRTPICEQGYFEKPSETFPGFVQLENGNLVPEPYPNQGLYECSIRAVTEWENPDYMHDHPNYYSRYMDHHPSEWSSHSRYQLEPEDPHYWNNMGWPYTYYHTVPDGNHTNRGWTRDGYWERVPGNHWRKGKCTVEFSRVCPGNPTKALDVRTLKQGFTVADTDSAFRSIIYHTDVKTRSVGRWEVSGGECIDHVHRGCKNNGTCVAPNTCECAPGWTGWDCTTPVCSQSCSRDDDEDLGYDNNNLKIFRKGRGNCTLPDTCTCQKGWTGHDCSVAICAQECNNNGVCTAPDTCTCARWYSTWRDERRDGGRPIFQDDQGNPQLTGWTGYDCSTPICVQAEKWVPNDELGSVRLGGHGLILYGEEPFNNLRRPDLTQPPYLPYTLSNDIPPIKIWIDSLREYNLGLWALPQEFFEEAYRLCRMQKNRFCTQYPNASPLRPTWSPGDGEVVRNDGRSYQSGCKEWSGRFSDTQEGITNGFLCNVLHWEQGDYDHGRYIRQSVDATMYLENLTLALLGIDSVDPKWYLDLNAPIGEGVYECYNHGSCIAPDTCTCPDGFDGTDCSTPLCRHKQINGEVVSCLNGGECIGKDQCQCMQTDSILHQSYHDMKPGITGYNGTDCSIPICLQGTFDPFCTDVTLGGEGCFRCKNGGNCTAPDHCTCPPEWTGYDCGTPVCTLRADEEIVVDLLTQDVVKVHAFELDPCQHEKKVWWNGIPMGQGNCTAPDTCTCLCTNRAWIDEDGEWTDEPWHDPLGGDTPIGFIEGTLSCVEGFEGTKDSETGLFKSCHLTIYIPKWYERYVITLIVLGSVFGVLLGITYVRIRRKIRQRYLLLRAERRLTTDDGEIVPLRKRRKKKTGVDTKATKKKRRTVRKVT